MSVHHLSGPNVKEQEAQYKESMFYPPFTPSKLKVMFDGQNNEILEKRKVSERRDGNYAQIEYVLSRSQIKEAIRKVEANECLVRSIASHIESVRAGKIDLAQDDANYFPFAQEVFSASGCGTGGYDRIFRIFVVQTVTSYIAASIVDREEITL